MGPKRSGKGTIGRVLMELLGRLNICGPTLAGLAQNFGLEPLIGKTLALIADARLSGRADQATIAERLLSITGEDTLTVDRKYKSAWTGKLGVRFVILTNELPKLGDASGALVSRFILLTLTRSFYGMEDHGLTARLLTELPGIFNWALDGLERLQRRGHFVQPMAGRPALEELERLSSPVMAFISECCEVAAKAIIPRKALYAAWKDWCQEEEEHPGSSGSFGRYLRAALPVIQDRRLKINGILQPREYVGIRLAGVRDRVIPPEPEGTEDDEMEVEI